MREVVSALTLAWGGLFTGRVLLLVTLPFAAALLLWGVLAWWFWNDWATWLAAAVRLDAAGDWLARFDLRWLASGSLWLLLLALLVPTTLFTALLAIALVAMPVLVDVIARRHFPALERHHGGSNAGSLFNALSSFAIYLALWLLSIPLWLVPPLALLIPWMLTAWLNQRLFRYDALAEHARADERERVIERARGRFYGLGAVVALLQFVPLVNLVAPIYAALAFTALGLAELSAFRGGSQGVAREG